MHQQAQTTGWKEHIDRKSIVKLDAGSFLRCDNKGKEINYTHENKI